MIDHEEIHEIAGEIFSRDERKFLELYKKKPKRRNFVRNQKRKSRL